MGEIRRRERNGRVSYLARHYDRSSGRKVSKSFDRKQDANDWLSHVGESKRTGSYVDPNRSKVTVGAWADEWLESKLDLAPKTRDRYEGILRAHIQPRWGQGPTLRRNPRRAAALAFPTRLGPGDCPQGAPGDVADPRVRGEGRKAGRQRCRRGQPAARPAAREAVSYASAGC